MAVRCAGVTGSVTACPVTAALASLWLVNAQF